MDERKRTAAWRRGGVGWRSYVVRFQTCNEIMSFPPLRYSMLLFSDDGDQWRLILQPKFSVFR